MPNPDDQDNRSLSMLIHDLNDTLNSISLSVELALHQCQDLHAADVTQTIERIREDCTECARLVRSLRKQGAK